MHLKGPQPLRRAIILRRTLAGFILEHIVLDMHTRTDECPYLDRCTVCVSVQVCKCAGEECSAMGTMGNGQGEGEWGVGVDAYPGSSICQRSVQVCPLAVPRLAP